MSIEHSDIISNSVDNGIVIIDKELNVYSWNHWLETHSKIDAKDIVGKKLNDFFPDMNIKRLQRKITTALKLKSSTFYNTKINQFLLNIKNPRVTNTLFSNMRQNVSITPYDIPKGLVVLYIYDNTLLCESNQKLERVNTELEDSIEEINLLLNTTMEAIFLFDEKKCIDCNKIALDLFEYQDKKSIINKKLESFISNANILKLHINSDEPFESVMKKSDNSTFYAVIRIKDTQLRNRHLKILTVMDISELKAKDKLLAQQTKMAALGEMIGNIAHQWRQPLSTISTAASGVKLQKNFGILTDELLVESLDTIVNNSKHLSQTIDDFKNFLSTNKQKEFFNLKDNIQTNLGLMEGMLKNENIEVILACDDNITLLNYPNELTQAFLNIIGNTKDAFEENIHKNSERYLFITVQKKEHNVLIEIKDNATGFKPNVVEHIFEPYFTTKHQSVGTGLGLYMTHQIISFSMSGSISAMNKSYSYNGHQYTGASFLIELPLSNNS